MTGQISWYAELTIDPVRLDEYCALTREMIDLSRQEPGTLIYERYVSDDQKTIHIYERYADSDAAALHLQNFNEQFSERFHGMIERRRFVVFGIPTEALRLMLDRFGAIYMTPLDGFGR